MTVLDSSAGADFLLGTGCAEAVAALLAEEVNVAAPDVFAVEVLAVLRRESLRGSLDERRGAGAIADLGDLSVELFPSLPLRSRAWELRRNVTVADALFLALAEELGEPLATKDGALAKAAAKHSRAEIRRLG